MLIKLLDVSKQYIMGVETVVALDKVSLKINKNEYLAVIGSSGSGKSTLMNILGGMDVPSKGEYILNGRPMSNLNQNELAEIRNKEIGFVFQSFNLLPRANALKNVMLPLIYKGYRRSEQKTLAIEALEKVGLGNRMTHLPSELSGGQRQRVALARALVTNPSIILADEPTGNLDSKTTEEIMMLLDKLHQIGHTIIIVTHENEIAEHCHRIIRMHDGKIVSDDSPNHPSVVTV